ncbi:MAG: HAMP domain-containing histidine kinase, partial [Bdellovibrionales bacterium]|nr:HAMP domain-containing histidine kinase [Bdellovibrionales bacterium]
KPLRILSKGVEQFAGGNLNYRIQISNKSDFFNLSEAFNQMAVKIQKMLSAKEILLRDVSHELRSPLTRMNVAVDLLEDAKIKSILKDDIHKMEHMIQTLLESYKLKQNDIKLKKTNSNLVELLELIAKDYRSPQCEINIESPAICMVDLDVMQIERVLINLIENAIKYSAKETVIININLTQRKGHTELKFSDNGIGIEQENLNQLFEPFFRVNQARTPDGGGFGLGLSIVKSIVESHGGKISVESTIHHGTTFLITLPECSQK